MIKLKNNNILNKFLYSNIYILLLCTFCFLAWYFNFSTVALCVFTCICSLIVALKKDITPVIPIFLMFLFCVHDSAILDKSLTAFIVVISIFAVAILIHIIRFTRSFKFGKLSLPLFFVSISLIIGGANILDFQSYKRGLLFALTLGIVMLLLYLFILNNVEISDKEKFKSYIAKSLLFPGIILAGQVLVCILTANKSIINLIGDAMWNGWGQANTIALILMLFAPAGFYLGLTEKKFKVGYYLLGILEIVAMMFTFSRGGILFGAIIFVLLFIYCLIKEQQKGYAVLPILITFAIMLILLLIFQKQFLETMRHIVWQGGGTSGRNLLYKEAWENFLKNPFIGVGLGYMGKYFNLPFAITIYWYHSTFFQVLASLGIVGLLSYIYFYINRARIMLKDLNPFAITIIIGMLGFEAYSMIDVGMFIAFPTLSTVIIITAVLELLNKDITKKPFKLKFKKG